MRKKNEKEKVLLWKYLLMFPTCSWPCIGWNHFPLSATHPFRFIPQDVKVFMATTGPPTTDRPWGPQAQATFAGLDSEPATENWCRHKKSRYLDDVCIYIVYIYNIYTVYIYTRICVYESIHEHAIKRMCGIFWHWTNINHGGSIQNKNMRTAQVCRKCGSQLQFMASLLLVFGWQRQMLGDLGLHCILILKASWSSALRMILLEQLQNPMVTVSITWD